MADKRISDLASVVTPAVGDLLALTDIDDATEDKKVTIAQVRDIGVSVQGYSAVLAATTEAFTVADGAKLDGIETGATADLTGPEIKALYEVVANAYTDAKDTKLAGIATGATANSPDATLLARANHTGTQLASTISDFATAVAATAAVTANTAKVTNATHTGEVTGATALTIAAGAVTLAKMANLATGTIIGRTTAGTGVPEALTAAQVRTLLSLVVGTNVQAWSAVLDATTEAFTVADGTKLDGIEALADVTDEANVKAAIDGMVLTDIGTPAASDKVLVQDTSDSDILKFSLVSALPTGGGGGGLTHPQIMSRSFIRC